MKRLSKLLVIKFANKLIETRCLQLYDQDALSKLYAFGSLHQVLYIII